MAVYFIINMAYLRVIPADELMNYQSPAAEVAMRNMGPVGGTLVKVGIIISVIGAANGFLLSGSLALPTDLGETQSIPFSGAFAKLNK